jgi:ketosteroid isomerase-like protein
MSRGVFIACLAGLALVPALAGFSREERSEALDELLAADSAFAALSRAEGPGLAFAAYLVDDALQLPAGGAPVRGGANIAAGFDEVPDMTLDWEPEDGGVAASGDMGWTWGRYTATWPGEDGEAHLSHGKYLNVWVRDDAGEWRVLVDMGNSG